MLRVFLSISIIILVNRQSSVDVQSVCKSNGFKSKNLCFGHETICRTPMKTMFHYATQPSSNLTDWMNSTTFILLQLTQKNEQQYMSFCLLIVGVKRGSIVRKVHSRKSLKNTWGWIEMKVIRVCDNVDGLISQDFTEKYRECICD
jgi:hypothetical protein